MALSRPGVYLEEAAAPSVAESDETSTSAVLIGEHHRGPVVPSLVTTWPGFKRVYGDFSSDLSYAAWLYFVNGGSRLWVQRVAGSGGVVATRTLDDRNGTPANTLQVDALSVGAWGNDVYVEVTDTGLGSGYFNFNVYLGGTTSGSLVEQWQGVTMDDADERFVESIVNHPTLGSDFVVVTDLDSASAAPDDTPAATSPVALAAGSDGTVANSDISNALSNLDSVDGALDLNVPGVTDNTVIEAAITYAEGRGDTLIVVDPSSNDEVADIITSAGALSSSAHAAVFYPHVYFSDPSAIGAGAVKLLAPGAAVMGKFAQVDQERTPAKAPAGVGVRLNAAVSLPVTMTPSDLASLNDANVNVIRPTDGRGLSIMGSRTLSTSLSSRYLPVRRTLNYLRELLKSETEFAVFEPNDERLWSTIEARVGATLREFWQDGGLRGQTAEQAFFVTCDSTVNTSSTIDAGQVIVEVGVAVQRPAEFVVIRIGQWQGGQNTATTDEA